MTELNTAPQAPAPDPEVMKALMAKVAKIQKILGILTYGQATLGVLFLVAAFLPSLPGSRALGLGFLMVAPFMLGLAYATNFAKKDLTFAKVAFRNTAISQLGLISAASYGYIASGAVLFAGTAVAALILGGLAAMVIYQASKG